MASVTILSDNGATSGSAGLKTSGGNDGVLLLQTTTAGGAATTAMSISNTQVVTYTNQPTYTGGTANGVLYLNGSKAVTSGTALVFDGTNLGIGTSSPSNPLHINFDGTAARIVRGSSIGFLYNTGTAATDITRLQSNGGSVQLYTTGGTATLDLAGNLGLGVTPSAWQNTFKAIQFGSNAAVSAYGTSESALTANIYYASSQWRYINNDVAMRYVQNAGGHTFQSAVTGTTGNIASLTTVLQQGIAGQTLALQGASPVSGTGISFPATQSASSDVNTLDDYEEGTYTPTITVSSGTPTYTYQQGYYTKIGRQVFGGGIIGISNNNTLSGEFRVTLPFTIASGNYGYTGGFVSDGSGFTWPVTQAGSSFYSIYLQAQQGVATLAFVGVGVTAAQVYYTSGGIGTSWYFRFSFSIYV